MYKWKIEIILKSGKELTVYMESEFNSSHAVTNSIFAGNVNEIIAFGNEYNTKNILVRKNEIAVLSISVA